MLLVASCSCWPPPPNTPAIRKGREQESQALGTHAHLSLVLPQTVPLDLGRFWAKTPLNLVSTAFQIIQNKAQKFLAGQHPGWSFKRLACAHLIPLHLTTAAQRSRSETFSHNIPGRERDMHVQN